MKKVVSFFIALFIFSGCLFVYNFKINKEFEEKVVFNAAAVSNDCFSKISANDEMNEAMCKANDLIVMGSSEFHPASTIELDTFPLTLYNEKNYDYNIVLIGKGYTQSLWHTIETAAIADKIENKKLVLIISPQWFSTEGINSNIFASLFDERVYYNAIQNKKLSEETKNELINRTENLMKNAGVPLKEDYKNQGLLWNVGNDFQNIILDMRSKKEAIDLYGTDKKEDRLEVSADTINYKEYIETAEKIGEKYCTTNDFGIYDEYYENYIKDSLEDLKGSAKDNSFCTSPEYNDLKLFIKVCKENGINPLLVSVPVNGLWYDYTEFSKEDRQQYYQNIKNIADEYNVELADFSDKEYEKYFLCDIMHLGWKGWGYLNESFYEYYKKD